MHTDLGEQWNEQGDIGERLGVDHKTISNDLGKNCSFAKIPQDLGEQWNEQGVAEWAGHSARSAYGWGCHTSRYQMIWQIIATLQKFAKTLGTQWNEQGAVEWACIKIVVDTFHGVI